MLEIASLIVVNLLIASFLGGIIGFFIGRYSKGVRVIKNNIKEDLEQKNKITLNPIFRKNSKIDSKPLVLITPKPNGKDNLKKIESIDENIENDLNSLGIYHFEQISKWSYKNCDWIEAYLALPNYTKINKWVEQAKILANGNETSYSQDIK